MSMPEPADNRYAQLRASLRLSANIKACRKMLWKGSQSFFAASLLLPKETRDPATGLYAFCRIADDTVDLCPDDPRAALEQLRERLDRVYRGQPWDSPADRAMTEIVNEYGIPKSLPSALIEGFEWDVAGRRYQTLSELYDYAARVAGTVGAMMAMLMKVRSADVMARACDLGVAMQLTNIARDVGEDARNGRVYLPIEQLHRAGVDPDQWLSAPAFSPAIGRVTAELLGAADVLYQRAESGIAQLPLGCRPGIFAARLIYAEIGNVIRDNAYDSVSQRAVVMHPRKLQLLTRAVRETASARDRDHTPPLDEVRFLVQAVAEAWREPGRMPRSLFS